MADVMRRFALARTWGQRIPMGTRLVILETFDLDLAVIPLVDHYRVSRRRASSGRRFAK